MATFKNDTGESRDFPLYGLYVAAGETFEVPDDEATSIEAQPGFTRSKAKNADHVADGPALTGPIPVVAPAFDPLTGQPVTPTV